MLRLATLHPDWILIGKLALPASLGLLAASMLLLARALAGQRRALHGELARIFEQLDLLRFDVQQSDAAVATEGAVPAPAPALRPAGAASDHGASDYYAAAQLAARGSSAAEIADRCGIVNGEARVLVALQQARARRALRS